LLRIDTCFGPASVAHVKTWSNQTKSWPGNHSYKSP